VGALKRLDDAPAPAGRTTPRRFFAQQDSFCSVQTSFSLP
jgi:hypothetical protein